MHIYFYGPPTGKRDAQRAYRLIMDQLRQTDAYVSTNTEDEAIQVSAEVAADSRESSVPLLERMDSFIIEGSTSDPNVGFLLAHAIAQKKPTLYLYQRGTVPLIFAHLSRRELPAHIRVVAYQESALHREVVSFLSTIEGMKIRPVPRIKFTLRITEAIEEYLHFKTHNTKLSKADFLRQRIEEAMERDDEWQDYQRRRRRE